MALQRPYDINIRGQTVDGNEDYTLRWRITGDISVAYRVIVRNNDTDDEVYNSGKVVSYSTSHKIPSGNMSNGEEYGLIVRLYDENDNTRDSDRVVFQTSSRPVITVHPIGTISNQSYEFAATYEQDEGVGIRSYTVYLYNENQGLINQSPMKTSSVLEHIFYNLQSEQKYYVEFRVTSNNGLVGASGLVSFDVLYTQPSVSVRINAENTEDAGIKLNWDVIQIIGTLVDDSEDMESLFISDPNNPDNQFIDLRESEGVIFEEGFNIEKDFSLGLWIKDFKNREKIIELYGSNGVYRMEYEQLDQKIYVYKRVGATTSHFRSEKIESKNVFVVIRQINRDVDVVAIDL